jgi:membrane-associated phospholipid phosphatase
MPVQTFAALLKDPKKLTLHIIKVVAVSLALALLAMYFYDQKMSAYFGMEEVKNVYWKTARILTDIGLSEYYFIGSLSVWALAKWVAPRMNLRKFSKESIDFARRWGLNFFTALIISGILTHIIKFTVGRQRPHKTPDFDPYVFDHFTTHWHWHSFSSGHSQVIFTVATMMSVAFPKLRWFWIPFAILICLTRVVVHDHFLSDIIFGACVGYVGSLLTMKIMQEKTENGLYPENKEIVLPEIKK